MRVFLTVLILIFGFQSWTKADDIRDFEIEGMSIGDSLLDYMTLQKIKKELSGYTSFSHTDKKFQRVWNFDGSFEIYEYVAMVIKPTDSKYRIYAISGMFDISDPKVCLKKQKEISYTLSSDFKDAEIYKWNKPSRYDETGNSQVIGVEFYFKKGGSASVVCYDFAKHVNKPSGLDVSISNKEYDDWILSFN